MCTLYNHEATEAYKKALRKKGGRGHAWKLVEEINGRYYAPFMGDSYNKKGQNIIPHPQRYSFNYRDWSDIWDAYIIYSGVFHCCITRKVARLINNNKTAANRLKIVKITFDVEDVVAVGKNHPEDTKSWKLDTEENTVVCVTEFKFAEK